MNGWKETTLGDVVVHQKGFAFKSSDYESVGGHPIVRVSNFTDSSISSTDLRFICNSKVKDYKSVLLQKGDVVIATVGSWPTNPASVVGKVVSVPAELDGSLLNQNAVILRTRHDVDQRYIFYRLKTDEFQNYIIGTAFGSANQASITLKSIFEYTFKIPPKVEQNAIAAILGALDDKIELNRRMNATLEAMARALFKSWFVDFDPVRAKMVGTQPFGMDSETAALFPSRLVSSELGDIPEGWSVGTLGDLIIQKNNRIVPNDYTASVPYVPIECISPKSIFLINSEQGLNAQSSLITFKKHDIIFGAMRPYFHKVCLAPFDGVTRTTAFVLAPRNADDRMFSLFRMFDEDTILHATNNSEGSTIPYAKWNGSLEKMSIIIPSVKVRKLFGLSIKDVISKGEKNIDEAISLARTRDYLLPKLISGDIRIPDVEKIVRAI